MPKTQQEIVREGYQILIESMGVVDALRFIQHFNSGQGDYTQARHTWLGQVSLNDVLSAMKQHQGNDRSQYDEIVE